MKETWYNPQTFCHSKAFYVATRSWVLLFVEGHTVIYKSIKVHHFSTILDICLIWFSNNIFWFYINLVYCSIIMFPSIILVMHLFLNSIPFYWLLNNKMWHDCSCIWCVYTIWVILMNSLIKYVYTYLHFNPISLYQ